MMRSRQIATDNQLTHVIVGEAGEDAVKVITRFALEHRVSAAQVTAVGAFARATVGWFDRQAKDYRRIHIAEQVEVLSLIGDIATDHDKPVAHLHVVLGRSDGTVCGGHLLAADIWPTLEVIVNETHYQLRKTSRPEIGLALIDLDTSTPGAA
jgi:predicted DNA-binding protein with PD1-like motif